MSPTQQWSIEEKRNFFMHIHKKRIWILFIVIAAYILSFFHRIAPGAIASELQTAFHASSAELGTLAATYFYIYMLMQIPTGVLVDTLGARKILTLGGIVAGIGALLFATAGSLWAAGLGRTLVGLGVSVTFISLLKTNANWFKDEEFATVTGIAVLLGNLGSIFASAPLSWLVTIVSWRSVFIVAGLISILLGLASWIWVKNHPHDTGLPSPRELEGKEEHYGQTQTHWLTQLKQVIHNKKTWTGFWVMCGLSGSFFTFVGLWGIPYFKDVYHYDKVTASNHMMLFLIGFAIGSSVIGIVSDRLKNRLGVLKTVSLIYFLCWLPLVFTDQLSIWITFLLCFFMGLSGSCFTLSWACAKEVNHPSVAGMATSVVNAGAFFATGILQPLVGYVMDLNYTTKVTHHTFVDFQMGFGILTVMTGVGLIISFFLQETHCKNIYHVLFPQKS